MVPSMTVRLRWLVGLAVALAFVAVAGHVDTSAGSNPVVEHEAPRAAVLPRPPLVVVSTARLPLRSAVPPAPIAGLLVALTAGLLAVGVRARHARRITDVGGDWRSLLLGAPPVSTSF